jgi:hypothetical protein
LIALHRVEILFMSTISTRQLGAALSLLRWRVIDLAEASGVAAVTIFRKEPVDGPLTGTPETVARIIKALEDAGIEFTRSAGTEGVRRRVNNRAPNKSG